MSFAFQNEFVFSLPELSAFSSKAFSVKTGFFLFQTFPSATCVFCKGPPQGWWYKQIK